MTDKPVVLERLSVCLLDMLDEYGPIIEQMYVEYGDWHVVGRVLGDAVKAYHHEARQAGEHG